MDWKIPLFDISFDTHELDAVSDVLKSGWLTMGDRTSRFEEKFSDYIGAKYAVATCNCTAALHLSLLSLGIGPGDHVICPSLTFVATANSIRYTGATPIFADVTSLDNWNIGIESIKSLRTPETKAIIVVHYAGYPCDMRVICDYAKKEGLRVVEDCAHAPGASLNGVKMGAWGDIGCFSFFSNKNISTGEGGMLTTNNEKFYKKLRLMRSHGMTSLTLDRHKGHSFDYDVVALGYNYRMTEITAALGIEQLNKLADNNRQRREIALRYRNLLAFCEKVSYPFSETEGQSAYHIFPVLLDESVDRKHVMEILRDKGIQTSIHYRPIHTFSSFNLISHARLPITEKIGRNTITLPLYPAMRFDDVDYVVGTLTAAVK